MIRPAMGPMGPGILQQGIQPNMQPGMLPGPRGPPPGIQMPLVRNLFYRMAEH